MPHDERLYCIRIDKSGSTKFKGVIDDLELVSTAEQFSCLTKGITNIITETKSTIHTIEPKDILALIGYSSPEEPALS